MEKLRRNKSERRKIKPGSALERGNVWVPMNNNVKGKQEYWNTFTMAKTDTMFREIDIKFKTLSVRRRSFEHSMLIVNPMELDCTKTTSLNSHTSRTTRPYPSGSCHTVLAGENSAFCVTSNLNGNINSISSLKYK
jgi:hypothetical protein